MASGGSLLSSVSVGALCVIPTICSYLLGLNRMMYRCLSVICLSLVALLAFKFRGIPREVAVLTAISLAALLEMLVSAFGFEKDLRIKTYSKNLSRATGTEVSQLMLVFVFAILAAMRCPRIANSVIVITCQNAFIWCRNNYKTLKGLALV